MSLFDAAEAENRQKAQPLAARMRPATLDEFVGQQHRPSAAAAPPSGEKSGLVRRSGFHRSRPIPCLFGRSPHFLFFLLQFPAIGRK